MPLIQFSVSFDHDLYMFIIRMIAHYVSGRRSCSLPPRSIPVVIRKSVTRKSVETAVAYVLNIISAAV